MRKRAVASVPEDSGAVILLALQARKIELQQQLQAAIGQRQQLLNQADAVLTDAIRLEGRLLEVTEFLK